VLRAASEEARAPAPGEGEMSGLLITKPGLEKERQTGKAVIQGRTQEEKATSPKTGGSGVPRGHSQHCYGDLKTEANFSEGRAKYSSKGERQGFDYFTFSPFKKSNFYPKAAL